MSQIHTLPSADVDTLNEIAWGCQYTAPATTLEYSLRCIALAQVAGDRRGLAYALLNKAFYEIRFCPLLQAEATLREAETVFDEIKDKRGKLLIRSGFGGILLKQNQFDAAQVLLEKVMQAPEGDRLPLDAYFALYRLGYIHFYKGEVQEGLRYYYRALALVQRERSQPLSCQALSDVGSAQMELGNYEEARNLLEQANAICQTVSVCFAHLIAGNLASVHLEMGNADIALEVVERDFPTHSDYFQRGDLAFLRVVAAQAYASFRRWDKAEALAQEAYALAVADNHPDITQQTLWMLGVIACSTGRPDEGIARLLEAEKHYSAGVTVFYILNVYKQLATVYADTGDFQKAYHYLKLYQQHYEAQLGSSSRARFLTLQIQHELVQVEFERDYALQQQQKLETLNGELHRKVAEIETLQSALREQVIRDALTGLYNRRFLSEQIGPLLDNAQRTKSPLCVIMLDIDFFKRINDTYGHGFGDQVLVELARLLEDHTRSSDLAVRYGGEEFCLVFPAANATNAQVRLEFLLKQFTACTIFFGNKSIANLTFSAGIAEFPLDGNTPAALLLAADVALYHAKNLGRNQVLQTQRGMLQPKGKRADSAL
jgi:diguanylate cyclase (GGDEF)-like protein